VKTLVRIRVRVEVRVGGYKKQKTIQWIEETQSYSYPCYTIVMSKASSPLFTTMMSHSKQSALYEGVRVRVVVMVRVGVIVRVGVMVRIMSKGSSPLLTTIISHSKQSDLFVEREKELAQICSLNSQPLK
jgi:hypothetical protein